MVTVLWGRHLRGAVNPSGPSSGCGAAGFHSHVVARLFVFKAATELKEEDGISVS